MKLLLSAFLVALLCGCSTYPYYPGPAGGGYAPLHSGWYPTSNGSYAYFTAPPKAGSKSKSKGGKGK